MSGTLSRGDLRADHKAALGSAVNKFAAPNNTDLDRHLNHAALALSRIKRRTLLGELSLVEGECNYVAPLDCFATKVSQWGSGKLQPWQNGYSRLPRLTTYASDLGLMINLSPPPTSAQIGLFGNKYTFFYLAIHQIDDDANKTTINPSDRDLFLLLTLIEAMKELASMGVSEPIQLHRGMGSYPANGTPSALLELFTKQVEKMR
ncbi:MAG: hypothetical protein COA83_09705 [Methylophaga sp.]|nr:MAG: hypothetical protein COA83_09705 [Methylophaga sp.]